jgi:hypothetical protein
MTASAPFCSKAVETTKISPGGAYVVEVATVKCWANAPEQWIMIAASGETTHAIASYDSKARIRIRWTSDHELRFSETGGHLWYITPSWKDVRIRHE